VQSISSLPTGSRETIAELTKSFERHLRAENKRPRTVQTYLESLAAFDRFLGEQGLPTEAGSIRREDVEAFMGDLLQRAKPSTASVRYRALQQFWRWALSDDLIVASPMAKMRPPKVVVDPPTVLTEDELRRLLKVCDGSDFRDRSDWALLWFFLDTGCRLDEVTRLNVTDLDLDNSTVVVLGKGGRKRMVGLGRKSVRAMDRYLRIRHRQPKGQTEVGLWLGSKGRMTHSGIAQVLEARGLEAKLARGLHPHLFRHTWAHMMKTVNAADEEIMALAGWQSHQMLSRYAASTATARALATHQRVGPGDRL